METDTQAQQPVVEEFSSEPPDATASAEVRRDDVQTARSEENITQWMSYLPTDCVKTMIAMGWDVTT